MTGECRGKRHWDFPSASLSLLLLPVFQSGWWERSGVRLRVTQSGAPPSLSVKTAKTPLRKLLTQSSNSDEEEDSLFLSELFRRPRYGELFC